MAASYNQSLGLQGRKMGREEATMYHLPQKQVVKYRSGTGSWAWCGW